MVQIQTKGLSVQFQTKPLPPAGLVQIQTRPAISTSKPQPTASGLVQFQTRPAKVGAVSDQPLEAPQTGPKALVQFQTKAFPQPGGCGGCGCGNAAHAAGRG
jgi:hypothetical protein